jgi:ankyrin repeat protein
MVALYNTHVNVFPGNEAIVRLLLSRGATVDIAGVHGTPLHTAASYGNPGALKILLDHHADVMYISTIFIDNMDNLMQSGLFICFAFICHVGFIFQISTQDYLIIKYFLPYFVLTSPAVINFLVTSASIIHWKITIMAN